MILAARERSPRPATAHARRVLVEAAWNYRFPARISRILQIRQEGQPKAVRDIAWAAQLRLTHRYRRLSSRKLHPNKICIAIARELAGFVWDIARQVKPASRLNSLLHHKTCKEVLPNTANPISSSTSKQTEEQRDAQDR